MSDETMKQLLDSYKTLGDGIEALARKSAPTFQQLVDWHIANHKCDARTARLAVIKTDAGRAAYNREARAQSAGKPVTEMPVPSELVPKLATATPQQPLAQLEALFGAKVEWFAKANAIDISTEAGARKARLAFVRTDEGRKLYNEISRAQARESPGYGGSGDEADED